MNSSELVRTLNLCRYCKVYIRDKVDDSGGAGTCNTDKDLTQADTDYV